MIRRLLGRWNLDPALPTEWPFDHGLALLNVRRAELACLLAFAVDLMEALLGRRAISSMVEMPIAAATFVLAHRLGNSGSRAAQQGLAVIVLIGGLVMTQWSAFLFSRAGHGVSGGYLLRLISLTMLFVIPPRMFGAILWVGLLSYAGVIAGAPLPLARRFGAVADAASVTIIAQIAGWLIYTARHGDYRQRRLIAAQNALLTERNRELDQLMAVTAHDLRSPLFGLRNLLELAGRRAEHDPTLPLRVMPEAVVSLDAMLGLVTRLLAAHAAEQVPLATPIYEDLGPHLVEAARRIAPLANGWGVGVTLDLPDLPVHTHFDGQAIARILDNLLANAVRYSPPDSPVRLGCVRSGDRVIVTVEDAGPGVDPADLPRLFRKFGRRFDAQADRSAGAGLGLFIAATYAERTGGTLRYRATLPRGATFELSLPAPASV